jgi:23S rRNA (cytosine1962-C5)-methyltransferase
MTPTISSLEQAWRWRHEQRLSSDAYRLFHGPGEAVGALSKITIESFTQLGMSHYWVTDFSDSKSHQTLEEVGTFLKEKGAQSAVLLSRPEPGQPPEPPKILFGEAPENLLVEENGLRYQIRMRGSRHPGLFLDHEPLRAWLKKHLAPGARVLNTFCYTGSLSIAAKAGGASSVTNLDLSPSYLKWSAANWELNGFSTRDLKCIEDDTLKVLPRLAKQSQKFDCVILDPPSFARSPGGTFSTKKDLTRLHALALDVLAPGGILITSINSESIPRSTYFNQVQAAVTEKQMKLLTLLELSQPATFPTLTELELPKDRGNTPSPRYLKGWIFKNIN